MWAADCGAVRDALALTPVFLKARANELDFKDLQVPLGRRFRALKLWAVLRCYGAEALRAHAAHQCEAAAWLARRIMEDGRFELADEPRLGLVCFRLKAAPASAGIPASSNNGAGAGSPAKDPARRLNQRLLAAVNGTGSAFLIHTELEGVFTLRAAVGALTQQPRHVAAMWRLVQAEAAGVLESEE
jgi:glutamate/tyrosine decarboxylase-like PLP-dependent enzyme